MPCLHAPDPTLPTRQLQSKIRNYVEFQWSVTKGINIDTIEAGLPAHMLLEMRLQRHGKMVEQVVIFAGCPREFFEALVSKLVPCICVSGDYVFYEGEIGSRMCAGVVVEVCVGRGGLRSVLERGHGGETGAAE